MSQYYPSDSDEEEYSEYSSYVDSSSEHKESDPASDLLQPVHFDANKQLSQDQSPLFSMLPAEIRTLIFRFALSEYEDVSRPYPDYSAYCRPGQRGHYLVSTSLLRTCRRVYHESWFFPFTMADHTFFLTVSGRRPPRRLSHETFKTALKIYAARHGYTEVNYITVLAQLWALEPGGMLQDVLKWSDFHPRCVTIGIRYSDWWHWETDERLHLNPMFANDTRFPNSVREIRMELETTMRRRDQVETIARAMRDGWCFQREDGVQLTPITRPRLTSSWTGDAKWITENESVKSHRKDEPRLVDYFIEMVRFRSRKLDTEEAEKEGRRPNNQFIDLRGRSEPDPNENVDKEGRDPDVVHREIGRIDGRNPVASREDQGGERGRNGNDADDDSEENEESEDEDEDRDWDEIWRWF